MKKKGFTLMELLIVVALVIILAVIALFAMNPQRTIEKNQNTKRKAELSGLKKTLENWYNDKNCYPRPAEICYDAPDDNNTCHLCGDNQNSPSFSPYLSRLPCDPQSPTKEYLYQVDNLNCPSWFRIYSNISGSTDQDNDILSVDCSAGCGPPPSYLYKYGVSSPNISLEFPTATTVPPSPTSIPSCPADLWCMEPGYGCKHCGDVANCTTNCGSPLRLFSNNDCSQACEP